MTADEFRAEVARLGMTLLAFGRFLDVNEKTCRRWASGEIPVPRSVELLLKLMARYGLKPDEV